MSTIETRTEDPTETSRGPTAMSVYLSGKLLEAINQRAAEVRKQTGVRVSRGAVIRSILEKSLGL